jgi:hypothetical protein
MNPYVIQWIGTGSGLNPALGNTSFTVQGTGDRLLLVDCGATVPARLLQTGLIGKVTDILITHAHGDHFHGLEAVGFFNYFVTRNRGGGRITLHFPGSHVASSIRTALEVSMGLIVDDAGNDLQMALMDYFEFDIVDDLHIPGLPEIRCRRRRHVGSLENFGLDLEGGVFYSGDTVELPPHDRRLIFQDCQFFDGGPGDAHINYSKLKRELPAEVCAKMHLVHLAQGWEKVDTAADGFGGIVLPGARFEISESAIRSVPATPQRAGTV